MEAHLPPNRKTRRAQARAVRRSREPGLREVREFGLDQVPSELQDFLAGCAWAPATGVVDLTDPDTDAVTSRVCAVVTPPDERTDALFEWRQRMTDAQFLAALQADWQVSARWGTFPLIRELPALVRLDLEFRAPQRFAYRLAMFADQAIPALQLAADGARVLLLQSHVARTMRCVHDLTANALPVARHPSEALRRLLAAMREDDRA